jgi:hypothetical protein
VAEGCATLPPGERIDELGDFLEWLANAKPEDEKAIRAEIKRYYYDVGDTTGGNQLNAALSDVLEPGTTLQARQEILNGIAPYADSDPADVGQFRSLIIGAILATPGRAPRTPREIRDTPREILEIPKEAAPHIVETPSRAAASAPRSPPTENPSEIWKLGWAARGKYFDEHFHDGSLHPLSRTIRHLEQ